MITVLSFFLVIQYIGLCIGIVGLVWALAYNLVYERSQTLWGETKPSVYERLKAATHAYNNSKWFPRREDQ